VPINFYAGDFTFLLKFSIANKWDLMYKRFRHTAEFHTSSDLGFIWKEYVWQMQNIITFSINWVNLNIL
jgi:hypothetical protein